METLVFVGIQVVYLLIVLVIPKTVTKSLIMFLRVFHTCLYYGMFAFSLYLVSLTGSVVNIVGFIVSSVFLSKKGDKYVQENTEHVCLFAGLFSLIFFAIGIGVFRAEMSSKEIVNIDKQLASFETKMLTVEHKNVSKTNVCYDSLFNKQIPFSVCVNGFDLSRVDENNSVSDVIANKVANSLLKQVKIKTELVGGIFDKEEVVTDDEITIFRKNKNRKIVEDYVGKHLLKVK